jgi:Co/Zn/Cd efflux system component
MSKFHLKKMDCPSEERIVRLALDGQPSIRKLTFDLSARTVDVIHDGPEQWVLKRLETLNLGVSHVSSQQAVLADIGVTNVDDERRTLTIVLGVNAFMFVVELVSGIIAQSTGLISDSLDNFADAAVYGLSLYAVGSAVVGQARAARLSGFSQMALALIAFGEVARRFFSGSEPESAVMIAIAALALIANVFCLKLVHRQSHRGVHMKASVIFSANDVIANLGVIAGAILVQFTGSRFPDLVVGTVIASLVFIGSVRIIRLAKTH